MKNNYMDYYYDGEAQALRCDTITFLIQKKGQLDEYLVHCLNEGIEEGAAKAIVEINRIDRRIQTELKTLCI